MEFRTISEMFARRVEASGPRRAHTHSVAGRWVDVTWAQLGAEVDLLAHGLCALGLQPGETVAILGETRPEWGSCDLATLAAGGRAVGIYQTNTPKQTEHILVDSGTRFLFVDTCEQLERIVAIKAQCPKLQHVILWDGKPPVNGGFALTLESLRQLGGEHARTSPQALRERAAQVDVNDGAILIYTSGTTGLPKGAVLTHKNLATLCKVFQRVAPITEDDVTLAFLPMSHVAERVLGFYGRICVGMQAVYARSLKTVVEDLQYCKPTVFGSVPRIFEKVYGKVQAELAKQPLPRRKLAEWAIEVGRQVSRLRRSGAKKLPRLLDAKFRLADRLVLSKIRQGFGGRVRFCITGAAPLSLEIVEFFHACGVLILEVYGLTETSGAATANRDDDYRLGTVGKTLPGVQIRIANDGEILIKGDTIFAGYHGQPDATAEAIDESGWFHSGDIGEFDRDGFLRITDRKKNLLVTAGGKNVAPANIEALLKTDSLVGHAVALGDRRPFIAALFALDGEAARKFASEEGISSELSSLARNPKVRARFQKMVDVANRDLARYEQVRKFAIVPVELTQDGGELTPTLKVKRKVVEENFKDLIDSLYTEDDGTSAHAGAAPTP